MLQRGGGRSVSQSGCRLRGGQDEQREQRASAASWAARAAAHRHSSASGALSQNSSMGSFLASDLRCGGGAGAGAGVGGVTACRLAARLPSRALGSARQRRARGRAGACLLVGRGGHLLDVVPRHRALLGGALGASLHRPGQRRGVSAPPRGGIGSVRAVRNRATAAGRRPRSGRAAAAARSLGDGAAAPAAPSPAPAPGRARAARGSAAACARPTDPRRAGQQLARPGARFLARAGQHSAPERPAPTSSASLMVSCTSLSTLGCARTATGRAATRAGATRAGATRTDTAALGLMVKAMVACRRGGCRSWIWQQREAAAGNRRCWQRGWQRW
jgi:hypothetical protein